MLFLLQGRHRAIAQVLIGAALAAVGIADNARVGILAGGVLIVWGMCSAIKDHRAGITRRPGRWTRS